ncbi:MAG TPA: N-acyl homoserine lactonase family protein [Candidatus Binatia bacterium]|nr:N-acyl homoserine lactonase family protein [Candidatus Binatia bacterium]
MECYEIVPLRVGRLDDYPKINFTYMKNPGVTIEVPIVTWVVRSPERTVVFDCGCGAEARSRPYHPLYRRGEGEDPARGFREAGLDPASVDLVVLSHLHWDHCGDVELFPNATFVVQRKELQEAVSPVQALRQAYEVIPQVRPAWLEVFNRIKQVSGDLEIAPGLQLVELPGHTTGLQGMRVATRQGTILLASDAIPLVENWEGDQDLPHIPNGIHVDLRLYDWTFHRMEQFGDRVLPSHDVRIFDQRQYG